MKAKTISRVRSLKTCLAFAAGIFGFYMVQAQQPQGIGKPAPITPPAVAVVNMPTPRILTEEDKANAAKSMEEYNRLQATQPVKEAEAVRQPQPNDAVDPRLSTGKE